MIANGENVNTELEQIGMSVFDGVIHLFCEFFSWLKKGSHPSGYAYSLLLLL